MKHLWQRITILLLALGLLFLCGCQTAPAPETTREEEPLTISIGFWNAKSMLLDDPVQQYIEQRFHVEFVPVDMNYANYTTVLQQLASYNQLPDLFASDIIRTSACESWITQGRIQPLPEDLAAYPHLKAYVEQDYIQQFRHTDGAFYALPRLTYADRELWPLDRCVIVRRDWMEQLNLSQPQCWEDFEEILRSFVENDPAGMDTIGLTTVNMSLMGSLFLNFFPELCYIEHGWMFENDRWMPVYCSENTKDMLQKLQDLYREGLLDPDLAYSSREKAVKAFLEGKAGAICIQYMDLVSAFAEEGQLAQAHEKIQVLKPWPALDGNRYRFTTNLHWSESYFGSSADAEKMDRIMQIYDWLLSPEFEDILSHGLEGIDWVRENGEIRSLSETAQDPILKYPSLALFCDLVQWDQEDQYQLTPRNVLRFGEENILYAQELLEWYAKNTVTLSSPDPVQGMSLPHKNNLVNNYVIHDNMLEVLFREEDARTAWPKALEELAQITPLREAIEEVTIQAKAQGITP